jgi:hypothetical protein
MTNCKADDDFESMELLYTDRNAGRTEILWRVPRVGEFIWLGAGDSSQEEIVRVVRVIHGLRHTRIKLHVESVSVSPPWNWPGPVEKAT